MRRVFTVILCACVIIPQALRGQSKQAVTPKDFGQWESMQNAVLSPDGKWLAASVSKVNETSEVWLSRSNPDTAMVLPEATAVAFSGDSRWMVYIVGVSVAQRERLERDKKPVRNSLSARNLMTGETFTVPEIQRFRISPDGRFVAMRGYPADGKRVAAVFVHDLANGTRASFGSVGDFAWADQGALLAMTIETENGAGNAVQVYRAGDANIKILESSSSVYRALGWRKKSDDLALLRSVSDKAFKDTAHVALAFTGVSSATPKRATLDLAKAAGAPANVRIADFRVPQWSKDGSAIYIGLRNREPIASSVAAKGDSTSTKDKISDVQVWTTSDVRLMPQQRAQEQQDLQRTLLIRWNVAGNRVIPIATDLLETSRVLDGDRYATEVDHKPYAFGQMFGRPYQDVWLVDLATGERKKVLEKIRYYYGAGASGTKLAWFDGKSYWTYDIATGAKKNVSVAAKTNFANADWDYPAEFLPPRGFGAWTKGDGAILVYDEFDVWSLNVDGSGARRLTNGAATELVHRLSRVGVDEDGYDLSKPLVLSTFGKRNKKSGYARLAQDGTVSQLLLEDARVGSLMRADSADVFAFTRERFDVSPNYFVGSALLTDAKQRTRANSFMSNYAWGKSEIVNYKSKTGRPLQAALYYPANYDASKKYPMIVYTYEMLSDNVHNFVVPNERSYYNFSVFNANGYFVLTPDIVFRDGEPGISTLESVEPAVAAIVAKGVVDPAHVGHVGHSWGGYEAAFLPTRTRIFAASVAGAAITNMLSFAGMVHWTPGIAEYDHWETGQARMAVPPWENVQGYLRNSPIAKINDLNSPMLMEVGDADGTVDWHQGLEYYNSARRAGKKNFVMLYYPGEDHGLRKKENQIDYERRILQWFGHYLKGDPAPTWITQGVNWLDRKAALDTK